MSLEYVKKRTLTPFGRGEFFIFVNLYLPDASLLSHFLISWVANLFDKGFRESRTAASSCWDSYSSPLISWQDNLLERCLLLWLEMEPEKSYPELLSGRGYYELGSQLIRRYGLFAS